MKSRKHRNGRAHERPPFIDPAFADALAGQSESALKDRNRKHHHKAMQLCRQVQRVLSLSLGAGSGDELLGRVYVSDVTPGPDASRLLVRVTVPRGVDLAELLERLSRATPALRAEVARAITRKRAPELAFIPVASGEVTP